MAIKAKFFPGAGLLSETGDDVDNTIVTSRDAAGQILVNGGAVPVDGGQATVANTATIQVFGKGGDGQVFGEGGNDRMIWNPGDDSDLFEDGDGTDTAEVNGGNGADNGRQSERMFAG